MKYLILTSKALDFGYHSVILNDLHAHFENQSIFLNAFLKDLMIESDKWTNIDS